MDKTEAGAAGDYQSIKGKMAIVWGRLLTKGMETSEKYHKIGGKIKNPLLGLGTLLGFWFEWEVNGNIAEI